MPSDAIIGAIPARYASVRLPGKPLRRLAGRPLVEHVYRRCREVPSLSRVVVLTDDQRIAEAVAGFGGECEMTPASCASGTDRIAHAARRWEASAIVNIQGDEPLIDPAAVEAVARHLRQTPADSMVTLAAPISEHDFADPNVVKVVRDRRGYALYFSRAPIPYPRHEGSAARGPAARGPAARGPAERLAHVGIYGYRKDVLLRLAELEPTPLERSESLEQLRALENGIPIRVLEVESSEPGVDTLEDLARAEAMLAGEPPIAS